MIASIQERTNPSPVWNERFLEMLPQIQRVVSYELRNSPPERREDEEVECIANAYCTYCQLVRRGRGTLAYPTPLAKFAVRQVRSGRKVGTPYNSHDINSWHARQRLGIEVLPLGQLKPNGRWEELVIEDQRSTPADVAACRLDFRAWLRRLDRTKRAVASYLAGGEGTMEAARRFQLSASRISQIRKELQRSWEQFQGEQSSLAAA